MDTTYQIQSYSKDIESQIKKIYPMDISKFQWCHIGLDSSKPINVDELIEPGNYIIDYYEPIDIISSDVHPIVIHIFELDDMHVQCMQYGYNAVYREYIDGEYGLWKFTDYTIEITRGPNEPAITDNENGNIWIDTEENIVKVYSDSTTTWKPIIDTNFINDSVYNIKNIETDVFKYIDTAIHMTTSMLSGLSDTTRYQIAKTFVSDSYELYECGTSIIAKFILNSKHYYYISNDGVNWGLLNKTYFNTDIVFATNQNHITVGIPIDVDNTEMMYKLTNKELSIVRLPVSGTWKDIALDSNDNVYLMNDTTIYKIHKYTMSYEIIEDSTDNSTSRLHYFTNYLFRINDSLKQIDVFYKDNKYYTIDVSAIDENVDDIIVTFWKEIPVIMTNGSVYLSQDFNKIVDEEDITWTKLSHTDIKKISSSNNLILFSDTIMYIYYTFGKQYQYTLPLGTMLDDVVVNTKGVYVFEDMKFVNIYYYSSLVDVLNAHIQNTKLHPPELEREYWNNKLSTAQLTQMIADLTVAGNKYSDDNVTDMTTDISNTENDKDTLRSNINTHVADTSVHLTEETINKWDGKSDGDHTHEFDNRVTITANDIVGVISISQVPDAAIDRLYYVLESERFNLTTEQVQTGDVVASIPEGVDSQVYDVYELCTFYKVINDAKLNTEEGYYKFASNLMGEVLFKSIEGTPIVVSEYGIKDLDTKKETVERNRVFKEDVTEVIDIKIDNVNLNISDIKNAYSIHNSDTSIHISRIEARLFDSKAEKGHTHNITGIVISGRDIVSGLFPAEQLPKEIFDTIKTVSIIDDMYALTNADVHNGNVIRVIQDGTMKYFKVIDDTNLSNPSGYFEFKNNESTQLTWEDIVDKPTSLTEYGITDAYTIYEMNTSVLSSAIITAIVDNLKVFINQLVDSFIDRLTEHITSIPEDARLHHVTPEQEKRWNDKSDKNHKHILDGNVTINASDIVSGTIKREYLPDDAFDIIKNVFSENERYALTKDDVQNGDVVVVYEPRKIYESIEDFSSTKWLYKENYTFTSNGYMGLTVASGSNQWNGIHQSIEVLTGEKYMYSAYVKTSNPGKIRGLVWYGGDAPNYVNNIVKSTDWEKVVFEVAATQINSVQISIVSDGTATYSICGIMLEKLSGSGLTRKLYKVIDDTNLNNSSGYISFESTSPALSFWIDVFDKPNTVFGYYIIDLYSKTEFDELISRITARVQELYCDAYFTKLTSLESSYATSLFAPTKLIKDQVDANLIGRVMNNGEITNVVDYKENLTTLDISFNEKYTELLTLLG